MSSISKVTGDIISKTEENKDYNPEEVVCLDPEYARNYNDCIVFENTQQKQNTLVKLSDEATTSFCNELLKVYSKCE